MTLRWTPEQLEAHRKRMGGAKGSEQRIRNKAADELLARTPTAKPSKYGAITPKPAPKPTPLQRNYALGRLKTGVMNKTESSYAAYLEQRKQAGEILWYRFEGIKLRLADNTFLTIDFAVMTNFFALEMHEVKGYWADDARAKTKIAADQYPFRFIAVTPKTKKDGGGWKVEEF